MLLRPFLNDAGSCASYILGCTTHGNLAVVELHTPHSPTGLHASLCRLLELPDHAVVFPSHDGGSVYRRGL